MSDRQHLHASDTAITTSTRPPERTTSPDVVALGDVALVRYAKGGDVAAFEELVRRHHRRMFAVALRVVRNPADAEDVTQDAFVRAWRALPGYRGDSAFSTWLYRITTNVALNHVNRRRDLPTDEVPERGDRRSDTEQRVVGRERLDVVLAALDELTPEQRATYVLRDVEGLSYDDIAVSLGVSLSAVKSRLFRARTLIAERLADYDRPAATGGGELP